MESSSVVTDIESKTKVSSKFSIGSAIFIVVYLVIALMLRKYVATRLFIPYLIFSLVMGGYLMLPSSTNKGRNNLHSIAVFFKKDTTIYHPYHQMVKAVEQDDVEYGEKTNE